MNDYTKSYLFPKTNFFIGMGSCLNIAGGYYNFDAILKRTDAEAIESDWQMLSNDWAHVIKRKDKNHLT